MDHPSVQLKNPDEEDEFGDFTSAPVNGISSIQEAGIVSGVFFNPMPEDLQEDEFGDFCGPVPIQQQPPPLVAGVKPQPNYDIDLDILTPQLPWIAQQQQPIDVTAIDEFNAFKSAQSDKVEEEFSQFESAIPHMAQAIDLLDVTQELSTGISFPADGIQPTPVTYAIDLLDAVGSSVVADIPVLSFSPPPTLSEVAIEDDFGDFTAAGPEVIPDNFQPNEIEESLATSCQNLPLNEESVEIAQISMLDENHLDREPTQPQLEDLQSAEETWNGMKPTEEDEFGEFSGQQMDAMVEEEDEFDDFEAAPPVTCPVEANPSAMAPDKGTDEEDEFDDFETAPPATCFPEETNPASASPETQIQRVLVNLFPLAAEAGSVEASNGCPSPLKAVSIGPLWSYVSQLDSTPALSFSWRHSAANQHFLQQALRLDSALQPSQAGRWGTGNHAWSTPPSNNSSHHSSSFSDSFSGQQQRGNSFSSNSGDQSSVISPLAQLDLDFFLNPTAATPSTSTGGLTADHLLETIERELMSSPPATLKRPVSVQQPPTPSSSSSVQMMSDIFGQLQFAESSGPSTSSATTGIDLLQ